MWLSTTIRWQCRPRSSRSHRRAACRESLLPAGGRKEQCVAPEVSCSRLSRLSAAEAAIHFRTSRRATPRVPLPDRAEIRFRETRDIPAYPPVLPDCAKADFRLVFSNRCRSVSGSSGAFALGCVLIVSCDRSLHRPQSSQKTIARRLLPSGGTSCSSSGFESCTPSPVSGRVRLDLSEADT